MEGALRLELYKKNCKLKRSKVMEQATKMAKEEVDGAAGAGDLLETPEQVVDAGMKETKQVDSEDTEEHEKGNHQGEELQAKQEEGHQVDEVNAVDENAESDENALVEENAKVEENAEAGENAKVDEIEEAGENTESDENALVEQNAEAAEKSEASENTDADEKSEAGENANAAEKSEASENTDADEMSEAGEKPDEKSEVDENAKVDESTIADEKSDANVKENTNANIEEITEEDETLDVDDGTNAVESITVDENADADERADENTNVEESTEAMSETKLEDNESEATVVNEYASFTSIEKHTEILVNQALLLAQRELEREAVLHLAEEENHKRIPDRIGETKLVEATHKDSIADLGRKRPPPVSTTPSSSQTLTDKNESVVAAPKSPPRIYTSPRSPDPDEREKVIQALRLVKKMQREKRERERIRKEREAAARQAMLEEQERERMEEEEKMQREIEARQELRKVWMVELKQKHQARQENLQKTLVPAKRSKKPLLHNRLEQGFNQMVQVEIAERKEKLRARRERLKQPSLDEIQEHLQRCSNGDKPLKIQVQPSNLRKRMVKDYQNQRQKAQQELDQAKQKLARRFEYAQKVPKVRMSAKPQPLPFELQGAKSPSPRPPREERQGRLASSTSPKAKQIQASQIQQESLREASKLEEKLKKLHEIAL